MKMKRITSNPFLPLSSTRSPGTPRKKRIPASLLAVSLLAVAGLVLALAPAAQAATIGDAYLGGAPIVDDGNGIRLNIELTSVSLDAGTYDVLSATADTSGSGNVIPLLLKRNVANDGYVVLWSGGDQAVTGTGPLNHTTFTFTDQIVISSTTDVFAGMYQHDGARVWLRNNIGGNVDHDASPPATYTSGDIILDSGFSNPNLSYAYNFQVTVDEVISGTSSFAITAIDYDPDAEPDPTVSLSWNAQASATYTVYYSRDPGNLQEGEMGDGDVDDSYEDNDDGGVDLDPEEGKITIEFDNPDPDARDLFFSVHKNN
jgi:hypothetical protein